MAEQQPIINLEWMDEEVRRYRTELIAAQQRINAQEDELRQQARHIEDLESRLASTQSQLNRINVLERALDQYKEEIRLLIEQQEEAYQENRREAARIKLIEQDNINRAIAETRKGLTPIPRLQEELELRAAEQRRLNDAQLVMRQKVMDLEKRIDTAVRPISYLEEQRGRDARYIAQLQEQVASLVRSVDGLTNRFLVVEEIAHRNRQNVEELVTIRSDLQQRHRRFIEEMQMADQQRERVFKEWDDLAQAREQRMREFAEQMRLFTEQYQLAKSTLANLESGFSASSTRCPSCSGWPKSAKGPRWKSGRRSRRNDGSERSCSGNSSGTTTTVRTRSNWNASASSRHAARRTRHRSGISGM